MDLFWVDRDARRTDFPFGGRVVRPVKQRIAARDNGFSTRKAGTVATASGRSAQAPLGGPTLLRSTRSGLSTLRRLRRPSSIADTVLDTTASTSSASGQR